MTTPLSRPQGLGLSPTAPVRNTTTTWGVVLAVGAVAATLALNAPGGSNSIAGRAINATMVTLFPERAESTTAPPAPRTPRPARSPEPEAAPAETAVAETLAEPAPAAAPADGLTLGDLTEAQISEGAIGARSYMSHAPAEVEFRNVHAIMTLGLFNADAPDTPFLGFCGEIRVPEGAGWGRPGWKPFFISRTASLPERPQGAYLDMANPSTLAKCANVKPSADFTAIFQAGETDVAPPWFRTRPRSNLPAISPR